MPKSRIPSPARSQSALVTPRRVKSRGPRSVGSPARSNTSVRLTSVIQNFKDKNMDSFHLSPFNSRRSVLNDNTDIEEPKRNSWWKQLNDTSRNIMEVLEDDKQEEPYNVIEEYMDVEVLSQEKKNPPLDLPDSSDNESISSIIVPQRKLFSQKENQPQPQKKFAQFLGPRESMAKLNKTSGASDKSEKTIVGGTKKLFGQGSKPRSKPAFPTELLRFSPDKTVNKTAGEIKGQVRNLFGNRAGVKRKNNFADFIASESEEEPEIQPKVFGFQKKVDVPCRRVSTASSTTDIDIEDWKMLPSSTMVQTQLEAMITDSPAKKARLSKLSEGKESEAATNITANTNKTKQSNKSVTSKNKSKMSISKNSINKSKTSPKRNDGANVEKTVVNELVAEDVENDENEVSLHYSDEDPPEDNLEQNNENDVTNKTKQSNKSATSKNKSKMSTSKRSPNKSKISVSAQPQKEADVAEKNDSIRNEAVAKENYNENIVNKSKGKILEKAADAVQKQKKPEDQTEMEDENQAMEIEQEDEDEENKNQDSEVEQESEKQENESQEVEDENQESDVEQEDDEENESHEMEDDNRDSEVEQEEEDQESVNQEMEDENQESDGEEQENRSLEVDIEASVINNEQNQSRKVEVRDQDQEIENMAVNNEAVGNGTANNSKLSHQSVTSVKKSKTSLLINKSKTSPNANLSQSVKKSAMNEGEIALDNEGNDVFSHGDGDAQEIDNMAQNNDNDVINKTKESNDSVTSKNKSIMSVSKNLLNGTNNSPNESVTSINKSKMPSSISPLNSKSKTSPKSNENENFNENVADEDQIDAEEAIANISQEINNEKIVSEQDKEHEESLEVENESQTIKEQNQLSEHEEEEQEIDQDQENESKEVLNESEEVKSEVEGEDEEEVNEEDEENDESEDKQNESEEEIENQNESQVEDQSQEVENVSQEVDNDEGEDEEENQEAEDTEVEEENESQEEMDEDVDDQQESNEVLEEQESDGQNDAENVSQEEISGTDEGTPDNTHDTTGRNRKKNETNVKSPEAILHDNTNQMESFTVKGRNTSIRRTSMIKSLNMRPSLAPPRDSTGFSNSTKNSSAEGSGWDSHRITKKTLRQTFGRDFTPRKSLRALVMEKSAKRHTEFNVNDVERPRANSTELPEDTRYEMETDAHDVSKRTRQTTLEMYLQKIKKQNMEKRMKLDEEVRNSLKAPSRDFSNPFNAPSRPFALKRAKPAQNKPKTKAVNTMIPLDDLPQELLEDMKYKPPRRFQPNNASWITKRLYKFLESKLEAKYDYKARIRAEKLVESIYNFTKDLRRHNVAPADAVEVLKHEMARLDVVRTHFDFYQFFHDYMPREVRVKVNPDAVNKIPLPRQGVFADILRGNTVQG